MPPSGVDLIVEVGHLATSLILVLTPLIALFSLRRGSARHLRAPVVIACLLVIPFMVLEFVNRRAYSESFPFQLFAMMWLMVFCFAFLFNPTVRSLTPSRTGSAHPLIILLSLGSLFLLAWGWIGLVVDQMPCFLGVPFCD